MLALTTGISFNIKNNNNELFQVSTLRLRRQSPRLLLKMRLDQASPNPNPNKLPIPISAQQHLQGRWLLRLHPHQTKNNGLPYSPRVCGAGAVAVLWSD